MHSHLKRFFIPKRPLELELLVQGRITDPMETKQILDLEHRGRIVDSKISF